MQILELDSAWRQRMQKEQVAHLAHNASTSQQQQDEQEQQLLRKECTAAKQVHSSPLYPTCNTSTYYKLQLTQ